MVCTVVVLHQLSLCLFAVGEVERGKDLAAPEGIGRRRSSETTEDEKDGQTQLAHDPKHSHNLRQDLERFNERSLAKDVGGCAALCGDVECGLKALALPLRQGRDGGPFHRHARVRNKAHGVSTVAAVVRRLQLDGHHRRLRADEDAAWRGRHVAPRRVHHTLVIAKPRRHSPLPRMDAGLGEANEHAEGLREELAGLDHGRSLQTTAPALRRLRTLQLPLCVGDDEAGLRAEGAAGRFVVHGDGDDLEMNRGAMRGRTELEETGCGVCFDSHHVDVGRHSHNVHHPPRRTKPKHKRENTPQRCGVACARKEEGLGV
mmetsp:Transcript_34587/g.74766  ORF Transcript_34587/g.74766 Transcript_34587/m.74766 type:complete len:317 (+) Transcript_34587:220-1170(+)